MQDGTFLEHSHPEVTESHEPHRQPFEVSSDCAIVSEVLARIGDKWSVLVVSLLGNRKMRFSELRRQVGSISQKMLTATLRNLERDGFITRTIYPTVPPKVEYELTDMGRDLLIPVEALGRWAKSNAPTVIAARKTFDKKSAND
jgi:DNA-binding HxlR family transcriptional regulator